MKSRFIAGQLTGWSFLLLAPSVPADRTSYDEQNLQWPTVGIDGRYTTMNQKFGMSPTVRPETWPFVDIAAKEQSKVLEIGPAYGIVCLEALKCGATNYWAVDMDERHLKILAQKIKNDMPQKVDSVTLIAGMFPEESVLQELEYGTFDAILCEYVLHFLPEPELKKAMHELALLLKPGGQLFITVATPYTAFLKADFRHQMEENLEKFQASLNTRDEMHLPCCIENIRSLIDEHVISKEDMSKIGIGDGPVTLFDKCVLTYLLTREGMEVVSQEYISMKPNGYATKFPFYLDGRETVAALAKKAI